MSRLAQFRGRQAARWMKLLLQLCDPVFQDKKKKKKKARKEKEVLKGGKRLQGGDAELQLRHTCLCVYGCVRFCVSPVCGCRTNMRVCVRLVYVRACVTV